MARRSFTHLHTHTEFSMLDGAARVERPGPGGRRADGQPALGHHRPRQHVRGPRLLRGLPRRRASTRSSAPRPTWPASRATSARSAGARSTTPAGTSRAARSSTTTSPCWPRPPRATATCSSCRRPPTSRATTTSPGSTGSCSSATTHGLIATTGCLGGVVLQALLADDRVKAETLAGAAAGHLRPATTSSSSSRTTASPSSSGPTPQLVEIARRIGAPLLATNDSHYTHREDAVAHDALLCVQTGATHRRPQAVQVRGRRALPEVGRRDAPPLRRGPRGLRQHPAHRRAGHGGDRVRPAQPARVPGARASSPATPTRSGPPPTSATSASKGPRSATAIPLPAEVRDRLDYELGVIGDMGFAAYFLVVWDLIRFARESGIRVGPGPRFGRRVLRGLLPAHRRPRPHPLRPALRAVPQPRAASRCPTSTWTSTSGTAAT